ncbi:MAG TPA: response regulator transcription factor [Chthonomonadaceae bacterium]|nr:response regulator transcription factor [Chthonomonadaceae bacterium]
MKPIRLVIVEARTLFRQGLAALLAAEAGLEIVGEAGEVEAARHLCARLQPDVILLGATPPQGEEADSLVALAILRVDCPRAAILVIGEAGEASLSGQALSEELARAERQRALSLGAARYVRPTLDGGELARVLHTIAEEAAGEASSPSPSEDPPSCKKGMLLTERDQAVMELIAQGLSYKEIASRLGISLPTVKTHVCNMLKKLELEGRTQLALYAVTHQKDNY